MRHRTLTVVTLLLALTALAALRTGPSIAREPSIARRETPAPFDLVIARYAQQSLEEGRRIFRFDTFGDEAFWSDGLGLDRAIAGEKNGGVGGGVSPKLASRHRSLQPPLQARTFERGDRGPRGVSEVALIAVV